MRHQRIRGDFCAPSCRLVIEVDGEYHRDRVIEDEARTRHLMDYGYRVIRFTNDEVLGNLSGVIGRIEEVIAELVATRAGPGPGPHPTNAYVIIDSRRRERA